MVTMFHELAGGWADLILPATGALERDGTTMNLEGRLQRLRRAVAPPCPDELAWISKLAARFDVEISPHVSGVFAELSEHLFQDLSLDEIGLRAELPSRTRYEAPAPAAQPASSPERSARRASAAPLPGVPLRPGGRAGPRARVPASRARGRDLRRGRRAARDLVRGHRARPLERHLGRAPRARQSTPRRGNSPRRRGARRRPARRGRGGESVKVEWYVSLIQSAIVINLVMATFAYLTLAERKVMGRMQLRYGPNRAGPYGLLQPIADLVKLLNKESFYPTAAIDRLYLFAPFLAAFTALTTFSVIPFGPGWEVGGRLHSGPGRRRRHRTDPRLRHRLGRRVRVHHRGLGLGLEVRASRLDAHVRAARLLRGRARAIGARRRAHGRVALADRDRRRPGRPRLVRGAAVRRARRLPLRRHRRDRPRAVRPPGGRAGARRRLPHRVRRHALRPTSR